MSVENKAFENIKNTVFKMMDFHFEKEIIAKPYDGAYVKHDGNMTIVSNKNKTLLGRSLMLLALYIKQGKKSFEVLEKPQFDNCGVMIDCSRNGVITVNAVKEYMNYLVLLGLNTVWLYMEDTIKLPSYPYFGYMRGPYSKEELKEIDDYAYDLGIEVIPYIQTLGHMSQFLRWPESSHLRDTIHVLLCDYNETYNLIEEIIKTVSECFRTKRINIGMDETFDMGKGRYLKFNKPDSQYNIFIKHLNRVVKICEKYSLKPMIEGDMLYCLATGGKHLYDIKESFPLEKINEIPRCEIVSWGYDLESEKEFYNMISEYKKIGDYTGEKTIYLGGIHIWSKILPSYNYTFARMEDALRACINLKVNDVIASMWGDDGTETNIYYTIPALALYSEFCYKGTACSIDHIYNIIKDVLGFDVDKLDAISASSLPVCRFEGWKDIGIYCMDMGLYGKRLFYADLLYNTTGLTKEYKEYKEYYKEAKLTLCKYEKTSKWKEYYDYAHGIYDILCIKADVLLTLRKAYKQNDKDYLKELTINTLPMLIEKYREHHDRHRKLWINTYKPFGWEVLEARYGALILRLEYAIYRISSYLNGEISKIDELEFEFIEKAKLPNNGSKYSDMAYTTNVF